MSRAMLVLDRPDTRTKARAWVLKAPKGTRVEFKAPKRSTAQNALLWLRLTDLATQLAWHGVKLTADDWKLVMLDALKREVRIVPNIDGTGFVNLGRSSSDLSKEEMNELLSLIEAFGVQHGVEFSDLIASAA